MGGEANIAGKGYSLKAVGLLCLAVAGLLGISVVSREENSGGGVNSNKRAASKKHLVTKSEREARRPPTDQDLREMLTGAAG